MDETHLPPAAFMVLAAVAWVDDTLDPREAEAIARAAGDHGITGLHARALERALGTRCALSEVDVSGLTQSQGLFLYAMATWVATLSWGINDRERALLDTLRARLGIAEHEATALDEALCDLLLKPHGMRPDRFDFAALRAAIAGQLAGASAVTPVRGTRIE